MRNGSWIVTLCAGVLLAASAQAELYRYVNEQGVTVLNDHLPPEYANHAYEVLGSDGLVKERIERRLSAQEREAMADQLEEERRVQAEREAQAARDQQLLLRYSSIADIDAARERALSEIRVRMSILSGTALSLKQQVERNQAQAASLERNNRPIPENLLEVIRQQKSEISDVEEQVAQREEEARALAASFERDIERFRELQKLVEQRRRAY